MVCVYVRSLNLYQFTPIAPMVPITVATAAELSAIITLLPKARHSSRVANICRYQRREKPVQCIPAPSLNE